MTVLGPPGLYSGGLKSSKLPKMSKTMRFFVISFLNVEEVLNFLFIYCHVVGSGKLGTIMRISSPSGLNSGGPQVLKWPKMTINMRVLIFGQRPPRE